MISSFSAKTSCAAICFLTLLATLFIMLYKKIRFRQNNKTMKSSPYVSQNQKHHVFPSFLGADVRRAFLSHIQKEFRGKGIDLFIDTNIERSKSTGPELIEAIRGSEIAMVLLSRNYASSTWCMNELVEIIRCREELCQTVMTIFYEVDPTDVKKQTGDFGKVFRKTCKGNSKEDIGRWRHALVEVSKIAGYHSNNWDNEADMIEDIATDVSNKLFNSMPSRDFDGLVGMGSHMEKIEKFLRPDLDEVRMIGVLGPTGIGKTTIARFLYNSHSNKFHLSVFVENIKGRYAIPPCSDTYGVKLNLQKQFISEIFNHHHQLGNEIPHLGIVKDRLKHKKAFVVLDDVDQLEQLQAIANETCWFGPWSRIIITTQDHKLLRAHGINHVYKVGFPSRCEALEMFCMYAFGQKSPKDGFTDLAQEITYFSAGKLPLALQVMGSYFRGMTKKQWLMEMPRLRTRLDGKIGSILKLSYDALCGDDQSVFLHIACFFNNEEVDKVVAHLKKSFFDVRQRLYILTERSLISIDGGRTNMHSLLAQLGKEIVRKQSVPELELERRQFLVDEEDIHEVLSDYTAKTKSVIGIDSKDWDKLHIGERVFEGMSSLQFLRFRRFRTDHSPPNTLFSSGCLSYISPKLRLLDWEYWPLTCLPFLNIPEFLVELNMRDSKLEKLWDGKKPLRNLKWMNLSYSENLTDLSNISTSPNLKELNLNYCSRLVKLPSYIGNATNLQYLYLCGCSSLVELPFCIGNATKLEEVYLSGCSSLVELPSSIGNATNLKKLYLNKCSSLVELPFSIGNATNLRKLYLSGCSSLIKLPSSIGNATNLRELYLNRCSRLEELPFSIGNAAKLKELYLRGCSSLVGLPSSIVNATNLKELILSGCSKLEVLPTNVNLVSVTHLDLRDCSLLKRFPEISTNIECLSLIGTSIEEVPSSTRSWSHLKELGMSYSENLKEFPGAFGSITELHLRDTEIQEIGPWVKGCSRLRRLVLNNMQNLVSVSDLPESLLFLDAENCKSLERVDCSFSNPDIRLNFRNCFKLNQEARNLIIQASTRNVVVLPGGEVPAYFTLRSSQSSLTVKLKEQQPPHTLTKFRACIMFLSESKLCGGLECTVTSKQKALTASRTTEYFPGPNYSEHLYIFEVKAEKVASTEFEFVFKVDPYIPINVWIKECGILPSHVDVDHERLQRWR